MTLEQRSRCGDDLKDFRGARWVVREDELADTCGFVDRGHTDHALNLTGS